MGSSGEGLSHKALTDATANIEWVIGIAEQYDASGAEIASLGLTALLAEVERQRAALAVAEAREAALVAVVERVATMLYIPLTNASGVTTREICGGCARTFRRDDSGWFSEDSRHAPECVVEQARALLASADEQGEA